MTPRPMPHVAYIVVQNFLICEGSENLLKPSIDHPMDLELMYYISMLMLYGNPVLPMVHLLYMYTCICDCNLSLDQHSYNQTYAI